MGLDCSHGAFNGPYSRFNRFRQYVARAVDASYPPHNDKNLDDTYIYFADDFNKAEHPGLIAFLEHSDCDGEMSPKVCKQVADELEALLPKIVEEGKSMTQQFIKGCREAAESRETLTFG